MMRRSSHASEPMSSPMRDDADARSLWRRVAQSLFAILCLVGASLAGGLPAGGATVSLDAAADKAARADASLDQGHQLLRPKPALAAARVWRAVDTGKAGSDPASAAALPAWPASPQIPDDRIGFHCSDESKPAWRAIQAGYARAPPSVTGRSRTFA